MNANLAFARRPARRQGVILRTILSAVILLPFGLLAMSVLPACTSNDAAQVAMAASTVPAPSVAVSGTIRTRVAATVKKEVTAHPKLASWANELAKVCFQFSGIRLPDPGTLRTGFAVAGYFIPSSDAAAFAHLAGEVEDFYSADFPAASAVQTAGTPYLTLLGQGIQDGVAAAGVTEAP